MSSELYQKVNYSNGLNYYIGYIIEYDLSKANINALLTEGVINKDLYDYLYNSEKHYREVYIGNMIKENRSVLDHIQKGIIDAKRLFIESNNIEDIEILAIKNDAIFILSDRQMIQEFGNYIFKKKSIYTLFFKLYHNCELYYRFDVQSMMDILEIKGLKDEVLLTHQNYFLSFLLNISYHIQQSNILEAIRIYNEFYENYINRRLDINYYREFNSNNKFRITFKQLNKSFLIDSLNDNDVSNIDINYNLRILRDLAMIIDQIYFCQRH